jgi:hypothetical protein
MKNKIASKLILMKLALHTHDYNNMLLIYSMHYRIFYVHKY